MDKDYIGEKVRGLRRFATRIHRAPQPVTDERSATIEHLERSIEEAQQHSAELRKAIDELCFRLEVQERSYAKQLADARAHCADVERELAEQQSRAAALEGECKAALQAVAQMRAGFGRVSAGPGWISEGPGRGSEGPGWVSEGPGPLSDGAARAGEAGAGRGGRPGEAELDISASSPDEGTINALIADLKPPTRGRVEDTHVDGHVLSEAEDRGADMIAPELVFPDDEESDDDRS
jgi:hypothetical protein